MGRSGLLAVTTLPMEQTAQTIPLASNNPQRLSVDGIRTQRGLPAEPYDRVGTEFEVGLRRNWVCCRYWGCVRLARECRYPGGAYAAPAKGRDGPFLVQGDRNGCQSRRAMRKAAPLRCAKCLRDPYGQGWCNTFGRSPSTWAGASLRRRRCSRPIPP